MASMWKDSRESKNYSNKSKLWDALKAHDRVITHLGRLGWVSQIALYEMLCEGWVGVLRPSEMTALADVPAVLRLRVKRSWKPLGVSEECSGFRTRGQVGNSVYWGSKDKHYGHWISFADYPKKNPLRITNRGYRITSIGFFLSNSIKILKREGYLRMGRMALTL